MNKKSVIVCLDENQTLFNNIIGELKKIGHKVKKGDLNVQTFSDNEHNVDFITSVRGRRVFILTSPNTSDKIIKLELAIDAARRSRAAEIIPIIPYFPYSRSDKRDQPRGPIAAKVLAYKLEMLGASSIITFDLHADQIQGFFQIGVTHMDGKYLFLPIIKEMGFEDVVLASPDAGGGKRVKHFRDLIYRKYNIELPIIMMDKTRKKANEIDKMIIIGDVKNKNVIIIDDMTDTGGSLCHGAAVLLSEGGAKSVKAIVTHGVLSGNAHEKIEDSNLDMFICSDTLEIKDTNSNKIKVVSIAHQIMLAILAEDKGVSIENLKENEIYQWN